MKLGYNNVHFSTGDEEKPYCPGCSSNDTKKLGVITARDKADSEVFKCMSCNRVFSDVSSRGCIYALIEEAKNEYGGSDGDYGFIGVTSSSDGMTVSENPFLDEYGNARKDEYGNSIVPASTNDIDNLGYKMDEMIGAINNLRSSLDSNQYAQEEATNKMTEILEKLVSDPLLGLKTAIDRFTLK